MTPGEFKAWFDGFTEAFTGTPTKAQWARIKARVAEIDGKSVTHAVYLDRYWPAYVRTHPSVLPNWATTVCSSAVGVGSTNTVTLSNVSQTLAVSGSSFNSSQAMADLGRAEAQSLAV